jgi:hypothetical protein
MREVRWCSLCAKAPLVEGQIDFHFSLEDKYLQPGKHASKSVVKASLELLALQDSESPRQ